MAEALSLVLEERKRASLKEVNALHDWMLDLDEIDMNLEKEMLKVVSDRADWDQFWQFQYDELIEQLDEGNLGEEFYSEEEDNDDLYEDESNAHKQGQSSSPSAAGTFNLINEVKRIRNRRIQYLQIFLDVESKRTKLLSQQAELSVQIKDLLTTELISEEVLDPDQEPERRIMISAMARWWDCLVYNVSEELNDCMHDKEIGKWSELYLQWRLWIDLKTGVFPKDEDEVLANYMAS